MNGDNALKILTGMLTLPVTVLIAELAHIACEGKVLCAELGVAIRWPALRRELH